jgi:hypothetical protein
MKNSLMTGEEDASTPEMMRNEDDNNGMSDSKQNRTKEGE